MPPTWNKKERENKKKQEKKQKEQKKKERKEQAKKGAPLEDMMAYLDENGNLSAVPPDPSKKYSVNADDIEIGVPSRKEEEGANLRQGIVTFFNHEKGYGFIRELQSQEKVFFHINSVSGEINENARVQFEIERGPRGLSAVDVKII